MMGASFLATALVCTALAQLSYKLFFTAGRQVPVLLRAVILFGVAQIGFFAALTQLEVGVVYMSTGAVHIIVLGLSKSVLREHVTKDHVIAVVLIVGGLVSYAG
jgi:multidrug transporter EmrE-like cation transporter